MLWLLRVLFPQALVPSAVYLSTPAKSAVVLVAVVGTTIAEMMVMIVLITPGLKALTAVKVSKDAM